ncbi:MAG: hypothetical protein H2054_04885 [Sphingomonas sp.]|uniref:hypothetical protein n=1 Tax=Sphingomonas sp. TaxID=28214 RepID=UPI000DB6D686|nr:hypothetical protein [Zymomonas sp.]MBA4772430.1 hypothetical protein [Sphingomonas sp.]PZP20073.1 MAG: hypothetical protein DI607_00850 [Sphingomonas hengshuiensis]
MAEVFAALVFATALIAVLRVGGLTIIPALPRMAALLRGAGRTDTADVPGRVMERAVLAHATHGFSRSNRPIARPMAAKGGAT